MVTDLMKPLFSCTFLTPGEARGLSRRDHDPQEHSRLTSRVLTSFISNTASQTHYLCQIAYEKPVLQEEAGSWNQRCSLTSSLISRWKEVFDMHSFYVCTMVSYVFTFAVSSLTSMRYLIVRVCLRSSESPLKPHVSTCKGSENW